MKLTKRGYKLLTNIRQLYNTPVASFELKNSLSLNKDLYSSILEIEDSERCTTQYSMSGPTGYHTNIDIFNKNITCMTELRDKIWSVFNEYYTKVFGSEIPSDYTLSAWAMLYRKGDYSILHTHPGCVLSASYYVKVPKGMLTKWKEQQLFNTSERSAVGSIMPGAFCHVDPRPAAQFVGGWGMHPNCEEPIEGSGFVFPSWLSHYVTPHYTEGDRVCISVNLQH